MKFYLILLAVTSMMACSEETKKETSTEEKDKVEQEVPKQNGIQNDGAYREFYENGQVKIEGFFDQGGKRNGVWKSYHQQGWQQSEIFYLHDKKNGHAVVFHPNGRPKYIGEYKDDIKVGHWRFYDEEGNLSTEADFE
ncbi:MAG: hypothetical protein KDC84_14875 [Crocinitomicaceae bacterium]|nr:hypothetical protein [Crocinitomicaceae bacterium]